MVSAIIMDVPLYYVHVCRYNSVHVHIYMYYVIQCMHG